MKILNLSLDKSILKNNSDAAKRLIGYGNIVEKYVVIVPTVKTQELVLSDKVVVYGTGGGNKLTMIFRMTFNYLSFIKKEKFDLISVQDPYFLGFVGFVLARLFGLALEIQIHGWEKRNNFRFRLARFVLSRADGIRVVSNRLRQELIKDLKINSDKIIVVPVRADLPDVNQASLRPVGEKFIFLTVGRLVSVKNISLQIKAMAEIVKNYPPAELLIVGDGPKQEELLQLIKKLNLEEKVRMLGRLERLELEKVYDQASAYLLTSNAEGWGLSVLEAAAHALPIIMTSVGCAGEIIKNEDSGLVIPVGDLSGLVLAMNKIIIDERMRANLVAGAKLALAQLPSQEETLTLYKNGWQRAISRRK